MTTRRRLGGAVLALLLAACTTSAPAGPGTSARPAGSASTLATSTGSATAGSSAAGSDAPGSGAGGSSSGVAGPPATTAPGSTLGSRGASASSGPATAGAATRPPAGSTTAGAVPVPGGLPGMPPVTNRHNVYAAAGAGDVQPAVAKDPAYAYVPHNRSGDVWVLDQRTHAVVSKCHVGQEIQHVVPSYDLTRLYATDDEGDRIREIDPRTGRCGATIPIRDPYNMYFTPDGRYAVSVAERYRELVWYDPHTWKIHDITEVPQCGGIDHADFSADGRTAVFTCEFAGRVAVVDVATHQVRHLLNMTVRNTMMGPQDIKLAPDGSVWYVADSDSNGVWVLNASATTVLRHIATGRGAHGLYLSRDATKLYVTNRLAGSVSVLDAYTGRIETTWTIPGGGSPDMGNVSADGRQLWISGRYNDVVYVFATADGRLLAKIPVGQEPHGLALMPLPGRYSLGHTGITR